MSSQPKVLKFNLDSVSCVCFNSVPDSANKTPNTLINWDMVDGGQIIRTSTGLIFIQLLL